MSSFLTTANSMAPVPRPLRDRMEVIDIPGYSEEEKVEIGRKHLLTKQLAAHGLNPKSISIPSAYLGAPRARLHA